MSTHLPAQVPKIIHQTWKNEHVPWQWLALQSSWRRHHPDWQYRFWTDDDLRALIRDEYPSFLSTYDEYPEHIKRVDAARYFVLHKFGGLYVDLDFESFRPIDDLLLSREIVLAREPLEHLDLTIVRQRGLSDLLCNAFMASSAGHPFWEHVFQALLANRRRPGPLDATGPFLLTLAWRSFAERDRVTILAPEVICPVTSQEAWDGRLRDPDERARIAASAYAAHHWSGSWFREEIAADADEGAPAANGSPERFPVTLVEEGVALFTRAIDLGQKPAGAAASRSRPRISCLMVTRGRASLAARAIRCFQAQSHEERELVIVDDDRDDTLEAHVRALRDPRVVYVREPPEGRTLGALRNIAVASASGSFVCQWDDDDVYHPRRVERQLAALEATMADACFLAHNHIWWPKLGRIAKSKWRVWEGSILCTKSRMPLYPDSRSGEDTVVAQVIARERRIALLDAPDLYVYVVHGDNTFGPAHFESHWVHAEERFEGASYTSKLEALFAGLSFVPNVDR